LQLRRLAVAPVCGCAVSAEAEWRAIENATARWRGQWGQNLIRAGVLVFGVRMYQGMGGGSSTRSYLTVSVPFIPAAECPGTVQR
jgi:hypothetical protein